MIVDGSYFRDQTRHFLRGIALTGPDFRYNNLGGLNIPDCTLSVKKHVLVVLKYFLRKWYEKETMAPTGPYFKGNGPHWNFFKDY